MFIRVQPCPDTYAIIDAEIITYITVKKLSKGAEVVVNEENLLAEDLGFKYIGKIYLNCSETVLNHLFKTLEEAQQFMELVESTKRLNNGNRTNNN